MHPDLAQLLLIAALAAAGLAILVPLGVYLAPSAPNAQPNEAHHRKHGAGRSRHTIKRATEADLTTLAPELGRTRLGGG